MVNCPTDGRFPANEYYVQELASNSLNLHKSGSKERPSFTIRTLGHLTFEFDLQRIVNYFKRSMNLAHTNFILRFKLKIQILVLRMLSAIESEIWVCAFDVLFSIYAFGQTFVRHRVSVHLFAIDTWLDWGEGKEDAERYIVRSLPSGLNMETVRCMEKDKIIVSNKAMKMKLPCLREIFSIFVLFTRPRVSSEDLMILWDGWQLSVICPYSLHIG